MKMKKVLCSLAAGAALLALAACGSSGGSKSESSGGNSGKTEITWWLISREMPIPSDC